MGAIPNGNDLRRSNEHVEEDLGGASERSEKPVFSYFPRCINPAPSRPTYAKTTHADTTPASGSRTERDARQDVQRMDELIFVLRERKLTDTYLERTDHQEQPLRAPFFDSNPSLRRTESVKLRMQSETI